jgi:hypothetical protein
MKPKYLMVVGSRQYPFGSSTLYDAEDVFMFEGEFDAMVAWQEWPGDGIGVCSLPANQSLLNPAWAGLFINAKRIFICHDMDTEGRKSW